MISIGDLGAPELGVRFSGVRGSVPDALAEAAVAHIDSHARSLARRVVLV